MVQKKTENEYDQLKRQNRRRLVGAVVMVVAAGGILASTGSFGSKTAETEEGKLALVAKDGKQVQGNTTVLPKVTVHNQQDNTVQNVETEADKQQAAEKSRQEQTAAEQARKKQPADESQQRQGQVDSVANQETTAQQLEKKRQQEAEAAR